jgi:DNA-binding transcriptional LysR family regulator
MELRQLRYFKGVAELLNFSRAAEQLRVAQSALSRQIQALEHEVGATLLNRDRSHVALTDAGRAFYASTCKLLLHVDVAVTEARQIARGATGELVVGTDWRVDAKFVSAAIEEFRRQHERVEIMVRDAGFKEQIAMLRKGEAHVGFIAREFIGKPGELQFFPIQRVFINAIVPVGHPFAQRKQVRLADLAREKWVDLTEKEAAGFRAYFVQQCRIRGFVPRWARAAGTLDGLFGHVASGYGITASPDHVRPRAGLPLCLVRTDCPPVEFGAVWRADNRSPLLEQFLAVLRRQVAQLPDGRTRQTRPDSGTA